MRKLDGYKTKPSGSMMYQLGDRIRELYPPRGQQCREGIVLVEWISQSSGLPLLSVVWDGTSDSVLELPEMVEKQ